MISTILMQNKYRSPLPLYCLSFFFLLVNFLGEVGHPPGPKFLDSRLNSLKFNVWFELSSSFNVLMTAGIKDYMY